MMDRFGHTSRRLLALMRCKEQHLALHAIAARYWRAICSYLRTRWERSEHDAEELTQAFLMWLLESDALEHYRLEEGGVRAYLELLLTRFVALQVPTPGTVPLMPVADPRADDPGQAFDRAWVRELVRQVVCRVRRELERQGRGIQMLVYEEYELRPGRTYKTVAADLRLRESDVRNHLHAVRKRLQRALRAELRAITRDERSLEEEWKALLTP